MSEIHYCPQCPGVVDIVVGSVESGGAPECARCGRVVMLNCPIPENAKDYRTRPPGPVCAICGAMDAGEYLGRGADTRSVYLCDTCASSTSCFGSRRIATPWVKAPGATSRDTLCSPFGESSKTRAGRSLGDRFGRDRVNVNV